VVLDRYTQRRMNPATNEPSCAAYVQGSPTHAPAIHKKNPGRGRMGEPESTGASRLIVLQRVL